MSSILPKKEQKQFDLRYHSKGGFKSEDVEGFSNLPKYIPFFYPKLLHPVHGIDKMLFQTFLLLQI